MDLQRFRVYTPDPVDLSITPADRMRAERASTTELPPSQRGANATKAHPNTWLLLWLWCAAVRTHATTEGFGAWADTVLDFDPLDADGNVKGATDELADDELADEGVGVDPTHAAGPMS